MDPAILTTIRQFEPQSLLECSDAPWPELEQFCHDENITLHRLTSADVLQASLSADLAVVHDVLESLEPTAGQQLLGFLRNSLAKRIWLLIRGRGNWSLQALIAFGFRRDQALLPEQTELHSYTYDIRSYNQKRSWNNSRFWANPENFHKYRW